MKKTPDQIRRETVPVKHSGMIYGFLAAVLGTSFWFGGWALLHQQQVRRYPEYVASAIRASVGEYSLFGKPHRHAGMTADQLRYALLRYGNADHRFDAEIVRHSWYPKEASPGVWVRENGAIQPLYSDSPVMVFKWPIMLSLFTLLAAVIWGLVVDTRYRAAIIAGVPFDGTVIATVDQYQREVKGAGGMKYFVKAWKDR